MNVKCPHCGARVSIVVPAEPWTRLEASATCPECGREVTIVMTVDGSKQIGPSETKTFVEVENA